MLSQSLWLCSASNILKAPEGGLLPSSWVSRVQRDVRTAIVAPRVRDRGTGTLIAWCGGQQKGDSPGFGHGGVFKPAVCIREPRSRSSANRAASLEEQKALGKDA